MKLKQGQIVKLDSYGDTLVVRLTGAYRDIHDLLHYKYDLLYHGKITNEFSHVLKLFHEIPADLFEEHMVKVTKKETKMLELLYA